MLHTPRAFGSMVVAPHHLASRAGLSVLEDGGNAVEAVVAAAAVLCVVYPHMCGLGGDGFWLIHPGGREAPIGIDACGRAGRSVTPELYRRAGLSGVPWRGPLAAVTVAGAVSGWARALRLAAPWGKPLPLSRLFKDATRYADEGYAVTGSQYALTCACCEDIAAQPGFAAHYLHQGDAPKVGHRLRQPALAATFRRLASAGLDDFYLGRLAGMIAEDLAEAGSPLSLEDFASHEALVVRPLRLRLPGVECCNLPAPTQGIASLLVLGLFDRLNVAGEGGFEHLHGIVEATKLAFAVRDREVGDPEALPTDLQRHLTSEAIAELAARIDLNRAAPVPAIPLGGDTVWIGAADAQGRVVSAIQSIFFEFGSGVVLPRTGIAWQNRAASFSLDPASPRALAPGRKPFHTLNPALAFFADGRVMAYGSMGGEGQPQTQAAVFSRYARFGLPLQQAVTAPRWLWGRTWGADSASLRLEDRFSPEVAARLRQAGHAVEVVEPFAEMMGHAGAIVRHENGLLEGAVDPRGDGLVACL